MTAPSHQPEIPRPETLSESDPAGESSAPSLRWTWSVWVVYAVILFWQPNFAWEPGPREAPYGSDYLQEWVGGRILLEGDASRLYDWDYAIAVQRDSERLGYVASGDGYYPMVYPPFWYAAVAPLSLVPLKWAAPIWLGLLTAAWFFTLRWAARTSEKTGHAMRRSALMLCVSAPMLLTYAMGQKSGLIAAIVLATALLLEQKRPRTAGLVLGLLVFKPHLMLLLAGPLVLRYGLPLLTGGLISVLSACLLATAVDPALLGDYFAVIAQNLLADYTTHAGYQIDDTHQWAGLWTRLLGPGELARQMTAFWTLATLGFVSMVAVTNRARPLTEAGWSAVLIGAVLASPHFYSYDLAILLVPAVMVVRRYHGRPARARYAAWMLWFGLSLLPQISKRYPDMPVQWSTLLLAAVFFVCCVHELRRPRGNPFANWAARPTGGRAAAG